MEVVRAFRLGLDALADDEQQDQAQQSKISYFLTTF